MENNPARKKENKLVWLLAAAFGLLFLILPRRATRAHSQPENAATVEPTTGEVVKPKAQVVAEQPPITPDLPKSRTGSWMTRHWEIIGLALLGACYFSSPWRDRKDDYFSAVTIGVFFIAFALAYSWAVRLMRRRQKRDDKLLEDSLRLWHAMISMFVSVGLGVAIAVGSYYYQKHVSDTEKREQMRRLLAHEVHYTLTMLNAPPIHRLNLGDTNILEVVAVHLSSVVLDDALKTDLFNTEETFHMMALANRMRTYNWRVASFESVLFSTSNDRWAAAVPLARNVEDDRRALLAIADGLIAVMNLRNEPTFQKLEFYSPPGSNFFRIRIPSEPSPPSQQ